MPEVRLQKAIARSGLCSRRRAERAIADGRVAINGEVVRILGTKVDIARDQVSVDGRALGLAPAEHWLVNKPAGVVTSSGDPWHRTVARALVPCDARLFSIGRLDAPCAGLLLFTNDGDLAARVVRAGLVEVCHVRVAGRPDSDDLRRLRRALGSVGSVPPTATIEDLSDGDGTGAWLRVAAPAAHARAVHRALAAVGHPVLARVRMAYGPLALGALIEGGARRLTSGERAALHACVALEVRANGAPDAHAGAALDRVPAQGS